MRSPPAWDIVHLDDYYQNNNALDPNIGQERPTPIPRLQQGDSLNVDWFQFVRERNGSIFGITPALSLKITDELSVGVSAMILTGSSDDRESRTSRGRFMLRYNNDFSLFSEPRWEAADGTSQYSGTALTIGFLFRQEFFSVGGTFKPSMSIKRDWSKEFTGSASGDPLSLRPGKGSDELSLPASFCIGAALYPTDKWSICAEYDIREWSKAAVSTGAASSSNPWLNGSVLKLGGEYKFRDWLDVRGGFRDDVQIFAPEGGAILDDPARGSVYTFGLGVDADLVTIDVAYEFALLNYEEKWLSNINYNQVRKHSVSIEVSRSF